MPRVWAPKEGLPLDIWCDRHRGLGAVALLATGCTTPRSAYKKTPYAITTVDPEAAVEIGQQAPETTTPRPEPGRWFRSIDSGCRKLLGWRSPLRSATCAG